MEDKKTFGAYVLRRRKELGLTQKAFAQKLFVTESAVSKWERGLSYPDITMLGAICEVLGVSEHELLTGSEDTQRRRAERLAERYLTLLRRGRRTQYALYGAALLGFFIGALASGNAAVFYIALPALMMAASLTLLPLLATDRPALENCRASLALGGFTASLLLLLVACWAATGGEWLAPAIFGTLFGLGFVVAPVLLRQLPLPERLRGCKLSLYLLIQTALLLALLLVCALTSGGDWFPVAALGTLFGLGFFVLPVLLKQLPLPAWMNGRRISAYLIVQTALLLALLLTCALTSGGDWFPVAALGTLFGLGFFALPVLLKQLPLPEPLCRHRLLIYYSVQTLLLALLMCAAELPNGAAAQLLRVDLPTAGLLLLLPWGIMLLARYLPVSGWFRGAACCACTSIWLWRTPFALELLNRLYTGDMPMEESRWFVRFNLLVWDVATISANVEALLIFGFAAAAVALAVVGWRKGRGNG